MTPTALLDAAPSDELDLDLRDFDAIDADDADDAVTSRVVLSGLPARPGTVRR